MRGQIEGLGTAPRLEVEDATGQSLADRALDGTRVRDVRGALRVLAEGSEELLGATPVAVGHRVVHGGARYREPVRVDDEVAAELERLVPLAPLHQPANLHAIAAARLEFPGGRRSPASTPRSTRRFRKWPRSCRCRGELRGDGLRRYGFHGLSYEYVASVLRELDPALADGRVIVAHLGSGASLARCGAAAHRHDARLHRARRPVHGHAAGGARPGRRAAPVPGPRPLGRRGGGRPVSALGPARPLGVSNDMRVLLASDDPRARLAVEYFVYRATKEIGALAAVLGGLDGLVFTAGIGENSPEIRGRIAAASRWLGVELDAAANARGEARISAASSRVRVLVVPTDEERVIARHVLRLLEGKE